MKEEQEKKRAHEIYPRNTHTHTYTCTHIHKSRCERKKKKKKVRRKSERRLIIGLYLCT